LRPVMVNGRLTSDHEQRRMVFGGTFGASSRAPRMVDSVID
jgi:hypothetical protein